MHHQSIITPTLLFVASLASGSPTPPDQHALNTAPMVLFNGLNTSISISLFTELEELSRIVDISYCVGTTGISSPFHCASRCNEFPDFELITTFNTGPLMSDSCGYIVLDHWQPGRSGRTDRGKGRILVAFRGTYSIANTIVDLSSVPQEYVPYPDGQHNTTRPEGSEERLGKHGFWDWISGRAKRLSKRLTGHGRTTQFRAVTERAQLVQRSCENCKVHMGFWASWQNTRPEIMKHLVIAKESYPDYEMHLVGHSLGGAVAALAGVELDSLGWRPTVTTFGEPRIGNQGLRDYVDETFELARDAGEGGAIGERYRRVTHVNDPVPLLPLQEWGYRPHAGEIFISKGPLQPSLTDVRRCFGDEDVNCIAGAETDTARFNGDDVRLVNKYLDMINQIPHEYDSGMADHEIKVEGLTGRWKVPIPAKHKILQLFFAHRDYFWRLGLCLPGGDPLDWWRPRYNFTDIEREDNRDEGKQDL